MQTADGKLYVVAGASRSGKTAWTRKATAKERRVCAWDPEDQWAQLPGWTRVTTRAELLKALEKRGPCKVAYVAGGDLRAEFDFWAGCVMYSGRYVEPLAAIAEELADVTSVAKAPGNWGILLRRGLKRGISIYALSQRWAEADKTAVGNASVFVLFRCSSGDDVRYLARKTRIPEAEIDALETVFYPDGQRVKEAPFVKIEVATKKVERGRLRF